MVLLPFILGINQLIFAVYSRVINVHQEVIRTVQHIQHCMYIYIYT